jgi:conjugal transfer pilus assembly protein TraW
VNSDFFFLCIVILSLLLSTTARTEEIKVTKNLGTVGETYPVIEPDVNAQLQERAIKRTAEEHRLFPERMKTYQPADLHHLTQATENRTFLVDMTYTLDHDLKDGEGRIIYPRGFTFNPLDYVPFSGGLVVLDGADPAQVKWFQATVYAKDHRVRLLITGGYAAVLVKQLGRPVFYLTDDIARRLQLAAVPSLVIQKEDKLQIREFLIPGSNHESR